MKKLEAPRIKTRLPGPKAKAVLKKDRKYISPCYTRGYPLVIKSGKDVVVEDVDGNKFIDMTAGIAVCSTGHCHPEVVAAIKRQAELFLHMSGTDFYYDVESDLAEVLSRITPGKDDKQTFFTNSGAEAVEAAYKLVRYYTRKPAMVSFLGGFHGRTLGALSLTASKSVHKRHLYPLMPFVAHLHYPYCYRCVFNLTPDKCGFACAHYLEDVIFKKYVHPDDVAAIIYEPIQGEGGYVVPPAGYFKELHAIAKKHGILTISDEIQCGLGRTGKMFAIEHFGVVPDVTCIAKGIASGLPLGAMVARRQLHTWESGVHATTFGGNPVACAAALKTLELIKSRYMKNAEKVGAILMQELKNLQNKYDFIGDVRGMGLMVGIELVTDRCSKKKNPDLRNKLVDDAFYKGLLVLPAGENVLRYCPSLTVTPEYIYKSIEILDGLMAKV